MFVAFISAFPPHTLTLSRGGCSDMQMKCAVTSRVVGTRSSTARVQRSGKCSWFKCKNILSLKRAKLATIPHDYTSHVSMATVPDTGRLAASLYFLMLSVIYIPLKTSQIQIKKLNLQQDEPVWIREQHLMDPSSSLEKVESLVFWLEHPFLYTPPSGQALHSSWQIED